ncbi:MAG: nitroreductase family protein [Planctomycetaceae bacterium]|nr:nitroreductase family protein [Planctomycetaceae bacterium]
MSNMQHNPRVPAHDVDAMFPDRWSPRAMTPEPISDHHLAALFEAARWTPSCYNEQPWLFCYATSPKDRRRFASALVEKNRAWASKAPLLIFLAARRHFAETGRLNRHADFDSGAAWMALALQARKLGLYAHAMAGFDQSRAHAILSLPKDQYEIMAAIAVGRRAAPATLPNDFRAMESPNDRKPLARIAQPASSHQGSRVKPRSSLAAKPRSS